MIRSALLSLLLCFMTAPLGSPPMAVRAEHQPPALPFNMAWHRYETPNFEVLSIDKDQGGYLSDNLESMRRWGLHRWGIQPVDFTVKCKVLLTPDKDTFVKLFKKDAPSVRVEWEGGRIKSSTIWMWAESRWHTGALQFFLVDVALSEFEQKYNFKCPLWARRGMAVLNMNLPHIHGAIGALQDNYAKNLPCFWTADLTGMTADKLAKYQPQYQLQYDRQAAALCLLLRKEFGQKKFLEFFEASAKSPEQALPVVGCTTSQQFDLIYHRFMFAITRDIGANRVPAAYLTFTAE